MNESIEFWDLDYNRLGLHDGKNERTDVESLFVPDDNTNPDGLHVFVERFLANHNGDQSPASLFNGLVLKSCYTGSRIRSDECLQRYIDAAADTIKALTDNAVPALLLTPIPDSPFFSSRSTAMRARAYAETISSKTDLTSTVEIVNVHEHLGDCHGFMRKQYRRLAGIDPHPNSAGVAQLNQIILAGLRRLAERV
jgi:hypothetical protein